MRKLRLLLSALLILVIMIESAAAEYPCSSRERSTDSVLLSGELIGTESYSGGTSDSFDKAWDGDRYTYYDPYITASEEAYTGIMTDEKYVITEIRILPRENFTERFAGAEIQGSNDGVTWKTIWKSSNAASSFSFNYISDNIEPGDGYYMFRYVNKENHGDVAEIELYGIVVEDEGAAEREAQRLAEEQAEAEELAILVAEREEIAQHIIKSPSSGDSMGRIITIVCISGVALAVLGIISFIDKRKRR